MAKSSKDNQNAKAPASSEPIEGTTIVIAPDPGITVLDKNRNVIARGDTPPTRDAESH